MDPEAVCEVRPGNPQYGGCTVYACEGGNRLELHVGGANTVVIKLCARHALSIADQILTARGL